jgi:serine/threonine-protein kinase
VLHELLSGAPPFAGRNMTEIVPRIINDPAPDLRTLRPDLADRLVSVVERALAKRPEERFASAQDMATALRRSLEAGDTDRTVLLAPPQAALTEEMLATAERKLAEYVGPIARILVKRARQAATSPDDFRRRLAAHIDSETDRRAFLDTRLS